MPLGRIIDIRKKVFAEVKVRLHSLQLHVLSHNTLARTLPISVLKLVTNDRSLKYVSHQTVKSWLQAAGLEMSNYGMCLHAQPFEH